MTLNGKRVMFIAALLLSGCSGEIVTRADIEKTLSLCEVNGGLAGLIVYEFVLKARCGNGAMFSIEKAEVEKK